MKDPISNMRHFLSSWLRTVHRRRVRRETLADPLRLIGQDVSSVFHNGARSIN